MRVLEHVHTYGHLYVEILVEGMNICDIFQANCSLIKLPPSWANYVSTMKHKEKDFKHKELITYIKDEE